MTVITQLENKAVRKRPWSVLAVGVLFLVLGMFDLWKGAMPLLAEPPHLAGDDVQVLIIGVAALVGGACFLQGHDWARWTLGAWMALHVVLSASHPFELLGHVVIFSPVLYGMFRPAASTYFRSSGAGLGTSDQAT